MMIGEAMVDLIDAPHASRRHTLDSLLRIMARESNPPVARPSSAPTSQATEASHLLDLHLPTAPELETMLRSALAMVPELPGEREISPPESLVALERV